LQTQAIPRKVSASGLARYALSSATYLAVSVAIGTVGRVAFLESGEIRLRPELGLAALVLVVLGWSYLPVAMVCLVIESIRTPGLGGNPAFVLTDSTLAGLVAAGTAYSIKYFPRRSGWGDQRDFLAFGAAAVLLPTLIASSQSAFVLHSPSPMNLFWLAWLAAVIPLVCLVPAGIKLAEWLADEDREPLADYLGQGVRPSVQASQYGMLLLAGAFNWAERLSGGNGRIYPMFLICFWMALTSGLPAASVGFVLAETLLVTVNQLTHAPNLLFDFQLPAAVMGSSALVAGGLVTARKVAEEKLREQGEALRTQLVEMQVIRRLADAIIALREESALYQLGAEAIGEQLQADQVWLLWIPAGSDIAEERGFWSLSAQTARDLFSPDLCGPSLSPIWAQLEKSRTQLLSSADLPNARLIEEKLDIPLHQASGIKALILHPFSFESNGFYVAAILSYRRFRHWKDEELHFIPAVADQITIALQKTRLLDERAEGSRAFARMSQALVAETGESFFRNLVLRLSEAAKSRGAYASRLKPSGTEATILAMADAGKVRKEFSFQIRDTPVEGTLRQGAFAVQDLAGHLFPRFSEITSVDVRGFASMPLLDSHGQALGTLAIYDDKPLTDPDHVSSVLRLFAARASAEIERSEREALLRESEASYRRLLETAHEGIWMIGADGRTSYVNAMMASMLGYSAEEMNGKRLQDYADEEDRERVSLELNRELAGTAAQQDLRFRRRDGSFVWTMLSMSPIRTDEGEFRGALAMVTDISERKRNEKELDRIVHNRTAELVASNKELEAFCYSVSHDLRQPLRAIDGFSRAVIEDLGEEVSDEVRDHLQRVRRAANRMSELIDALLTLSRLSRVEMKRERVDLSEMAASIIADLARSDPERATGFSIRKGCEATGDTRLLHIALENLLNNAWKFSSRSEKPFVEFGSKKVNGETAFYVRDNGIGFDMAYKAKLFMPFERLHSDTEFYGTGIGLATVSRIISRHGGQIWADAKPGVGATFFFTLPSSDESE
jgi:PAS domain S-box-containing protein